MLLDLLAPLNRLRAILRPAPVCPPSLPDVLCPLLHPQAPLPTWVAADPVVQKYRVLLGDLPWAAFPERPTDHPWPGPQPQPRAPFAAAFLVKLHEGKRYMSDLRTFLLEHPALVYWLGFDRVPDPTAPYGFDVAQTVPKRRHFSTVLRSLPNTALQFLLDASVQLLRATLPPDQRELFGDVIAGDTQALLAWVKENNPKQFIKEGRLDKTRQPKGDPDCKLGVKSRPNRAPADADGDDPPAPTTDAHPANRLQVGVDIFWGYASGIVVTRLPDGTEVVLAERTRPFNESDPSSFHPLMQQVEQRLGRKPRFGAWDAAYDAHYVYDYFHQAGGFAAVPFNPGPKGAGRQFAADGAPLCAAGLPMTLEFRYQHRAAWFRTDARSIAARCCSQPRVAKAAQSRTRTSRRAAAPARSRRGPGRGCATRSTAAVPSTNNSMRYAQWLSESTARPKRWICCIPSCGAAGRSPTATR
ncbi:MAG: hypothetical protein IPO81_31235 [Kouleothrix sp.]|nr:hypothetical protein [Kouleothrix sp.]